MTSATSWLPVAEWFHPDPEKNRHLLEALSPDFDGAVDTMAGFGPIGL